MKNSLLLLLFCILIPSGLRSEESRYVTIVLTAHDIEQCGGWPIARRWYGNIIQKLETAGAGRIFIDIAFVTSDPLHPESDEYLFEILQQNDNVFLLSPSSQKNGSTVVILGNKEIPASRTFSPFSTGFDFVEQLPILKDTTVLASALLHNTGRNLLNSIVQFPAQGIQPDHHFLEILQQEIQLHGKDVIVYIDYPGVTSYVVSPSGAKIVTSLLQVWTAKKISSGDSSRLLELWHYAVVIFFCLFPIGWYGIKKRYLFGTMTSTVCFVCSILVLTLFHFFVPFWYVAVTGGWVAASLLIIGMVFTFQANKENPKSVGTEIPDEKKEELESLRYQLKYYEQLSQQFPPEHDVLTSESANIVYHPHSPLVELLKKGAQIAESNMPVLLSGESGTGKEKLAQFIHQKSPRHSAPFIAVNCSSLNDGLIESELFGHEQGSFTGAIKTKIGRFELASGGTLFLDEIGETTPSFQAKVLRVIQENVFERVGGTKEIRIDVRIIAATNKNLKELAKKGQFREDLFYRLHGFELEIPSLRERTEDIEALFKHFLYEQDPSLSYSTQLISWLKEQRWQGNVRQLQSATQRSVLNARMHDRTFIIPKDFELGTQSTLDQTSEGKEIAQKVLEGLRTHQFDHKSIAKVSADLLLHRSTVTEYFRGWVIHFLLLCRESKQQFLQGLHGGASIADQDRFEERIDAYVEYIQSNITEGLSVGETKEEIVSKRFRKLPIPFRGDLIQLIEQHRLSKR